MISHAEDPDTSKKQRSIYEDVRFPAESGSLEMANQSNATPSQEVCSPFREDLFVYIFCLRFQVSNLCISNNSM